MDALAPGQADAVISALSAQYDAAIADVLARDFGWWGASTQAQLADSLRSSKAGNLRELRATAERHPELFADRALQDEKDLRDLSGYAQAATLEQVLRDTAAATVADAGDVASKATRGLLSAIPVKVYLVAGLVLLLGVGLYVRPLLSKGSAA